MNPILIMYFHKQNNLPIPQYYVTQLVGAIQELPHGRASPKEMLTMIFNTSQKIYCQLFNHHHNFWEIINYFDMAKLRQQTHKPLNQRRAIHELPLLPSDFYDNLLTHTH
jgi:hypothetical protein